MSAELKINPEYESLLPPLPSGEYAATKESIEKNGMHFPIIANPRGTILDGHNRFKICKELGIEPRYEIKNFENPLLEKHFVIEANLKRRHLTPFQKIEMALPLVEIEKALAKQRQLAGKTSPSHEGKGEVSDIVGKKIGVSGPMIERAMMVIKEADKKTIKRLRAGTTTIGTEYKKIAHNKKVKDLEEKVKKLELPEGQYQVIVVDPPWQHEGDYDANARRVVPAYPMMPLDEIAGLKLPIGDDCVLWLWAPIKNLHDAFHIIEKWGFEPKTILTWVKDKIGIGSWLRGQTEHCILATKGNVVIKLTNQSTALVAPSQGHSTKPDEFYRLVDSLCIGRKLDYFARKPRTGWDVFGTIEEAPQ